VQNNENEQWDEDNVNQKLKVKIERAADAVIDKQAAVNKSAPKKLGPIDMRTAALIVAVERVAEVALKRGIWP
jgi:glutamate dehydrogenase/leucine dehydrogenase